MQLERNSYPAILQATGSWDYSVRLWNLKPPEKPEDEGVMVLLGHKGNIHAVAFSKEGMLVK